ncbi:ROK family protein [Hymenobacter crusticola]|uniref:Sugar kinase n=1 Tax=Hymenobacter crusticola TaxID=1770526 RepID=A0A243W748_9BACT|nr:ROK family protein [Hymenobacter crusticola]OUJ70401.1 sugar kinase [Hymenobacter crusticola]
MSHFNQQHNLWGLDLGGTKIEGVILKSAQEPEVLFRHRVPTGTTHGYDHILGQVAQLVQHLEAAAGYRAEQVGIGTPGTTIPKSGLMKNCNATVLNGQPVRADLEQLLGMRVVMANDANCFALAETRLGVVKERFPEAKVVFGIILGTGVGGGLVVNGQILEGYHGIAGEWGHNYLSAAEGDLCFCGKTGCNESILAGPSLERYYARHSEQPRNLPEIVERATHGHDAVATQTIERLTSFFGLALSNVINLLDPDVIVIGGGVGNIDYLYEAGVASIQQHIFDHQFEAPIVKPLLGDSAGVFGAAYLVAEPIPVQADVA